MTITENEKQILAVLLVLGVIGFFYVKGVRREIALGAIREQEVNAYENSIKPFLNLALQAKSFAVYDASAHNFLYKKNSEGAMPLASLAKVMSAIVVMEHAPADHIFIMSKDSLNQVGDNGLLVHEKWTRDALLQFALTVSSNDAIHELALETGTLIDPTSTDPLQTFIDALNKRAADFGFKSFVFNNESGLDIAGNENGAYGSARDMARLFAYAVQTYPEIFSTTTKKSASIASLDSTHNIENTNTIVEDIPGVLASKTGFTALSGGNLVVAVNDKGVTQVAVVLGSTYDDRFTDMKALTGAAAHAAPVSPMARMY